MKIIRRFFGLILCRFNRHDWVNGVPGRIHPNWWKKCKRCHRQTIWGDWFYLDLATGFVRLKALERTLEEIKQKIETEIPEDRRIDDD